MYAKVEWNTYEEKEVFVSVYGCNRVQIKQVNKMPNLLSDCFKTQAAKSQKWKNYPSQEGISKCLELNAEIG
jgi:hypothetical protein